MSSLLQITYKTKSKNLRSVDLAQCLETRWYIAQLLSQQKIAKESLLIPHLNERYLVARPPTAESYTVEINVASLLQRKNTT